MPVAVQPSACNVVTAAFETLSKLILGYFLKLLSYSETLEPLSTSCVSNSWRPLQNLQRTYDTMPRQQHVSCLLPVYCGKMMGIKPFCSFHVGQAAAKRAESWLQTWCLVQAAQLRKSSFVQPADVPELQPAAYDPDKQSYCTVYAGTFVQQVSCSTHT